MRPAQLAKQDHVSRRAIFRFLRAGAQSSEDILLLSLADFLGKEVPPANQEQLARRLQVCTRILEFQKRKGRHIRSSEPVVKGDELMELLNLPPGPIIGELLSYIQEAQAVGDIRTKEEAITLARKAIDQG
jgi:hypothetical protein